MKKITVKSKNQQNQRWKMEQRTRITVQKKNLAPKDEKKSIKKRRSIEETQRKRERKQLQTVMDRNNLSREGEGSDTILGSFFVSCNKNFYLQYKLVYDKTNKR